MQNFSTLRIFDRSMRCQSITKLVYVAGKLAFLLYETYHIFSGGVKKLFCGGSAIHKAVKRFLKAVTRALKTAYKY
jgi:hypothetical protein